MLTRIKGYTFSISEPFSAGCVITKGEAQALNDLRCENIANNLRELVKRAQAELADGDLLPTQVLSEIQETITRYDLAYHFLEKHTPRSRKGDIELAVREVAEELVRSQYRAAGIESSATEAEDISKAEALPQVLEEARARVSARRAASSGALEDL